MAPSVRISRKTAKALLTYFEANAEYEWAPPGPLGELRAALKPKRSVVAARARKASKRRTKKEETAEIRAAVMARADGVCEMCSTARPLQLHHAFGRVRVRQATSNCLGICDCCHHDLTNNEGGAAHCWEKVGDTFASLCEHESAGRAWRNQAYAESKDELSAGVGG
jgi:5-methylcytosine-specific restriction endonuclease McrA